MHAVIRTGGKQYYVTAGDILEVEKLDGNVGDTVALEDVLLLAGDGAVTVGQPIVDGASVMAKITGQHRGKKIQVFRYRPKKRIRVRKGHRQYLTRLHIQTIRLADGSEFSIAAPAAAPVPEPVAEPMVEEAVVEPIANDDAAVAEPEIAEPVAADPVAVESMVEETVAEPNANDDAVTAKTEEKE